MSDQNSMNTVDMNTLVSLAKRRGFIYPGSEIYGGLSNSWDYGPLGAQMRMNIKRSWWQAAVERKTDMVGLDAAVMMNPKVWEASGHLETFTDPFIECTHCQHRFRADQQSFTFGSDTVGPNNAGPDNAGQSVPGVDVTEHMLSQLVCPNCSEVGTLSAPKQFNLLFRTFIGSSTDSETTVYLRPETAQAIFVNFKNIVQSSRQRVPFGVAQIGKAFRNEITPGNFIFRTLEFEQMEIEYFVKESDWENQFAAWQKWMMDWATTIGIDMNRLHVLDVPAEDLAHYSKKTVDFEFDFPFGRNELWGLAYRTDYDLRQHQTYSKENLAYTDPTDPTHTFIPHVIEPSLGVDRTLLAILLSAYREEQVNEETRVVLGFAPHIAPYEIAILPLSKKPELSELAHTLLSEMSQTYRCEYDETQSIGKRYRRQDEIGTPLCVTIDFDTLTDNQVTIRHRDTMAQVRVPIADLSATLKTQLTTFQ